MGAKLVTCPQCGELAKGYVALDGKTVLVPKHVLRNGARDGGVAKVCPGTEGSG